MKLSKIIKHLILILWCILIFSFSSETGELSSNRSQKITNNVLKTYETFFNKKMESKVKEKLEVIIRKTAHFSLYFILGILSYSCLTEYDINNKKQIIYSILFCLLYAISDEFHQLFSPNRTARIFDVFIDTLGSTASIFIIYFIRKKIL